MVSLRNGNSLIRMLAWFYAANFLFIFIISHWPGLTDQEGRLMGLFFIDPIDDVFHLLSGLAAAICAWRSYTWSVNYFKYAGIPYAIDAVTGILFGREFLNGDVFTQGLGHADFSPATLGRNLPHIVIPLSMMAIGFGLARWKTARPMRDKAAGAAVA